MKSDEVFYVNVYLKHHLRPMCQFEFHTEDKVEQFIDYINMDVDYIRVGDEVIKRKRIRKLVIKNG